MRNDVYWVALYKMRNTFKQSIKNEFQKVSKVGRDILVRRNRVSQARNTEGKSNKIRPNSMRKLCFVTFFKSSIKRTISVEVFEALDEGRWVTISLNSPFNKILLYFNRKSSLVVGRDGFFLTLLEFYLFTVIQAYFGNV